MKSTAELAELAFPEFSSIAAETRREVERVYASTIRPNRPGLKTTFYFYYPFLFRSGFPQISEEAFRTVAVSGVLYLEHVCLLDVMVDDPDETKFYRPFLSAQLHEQALRLISRCFPPESFFWSELWKYHQEFASAMVEEKAKHFRKIRAYEEGEYFRIAKGKSALSKGTTAALSVLGAAPEKIDNLSASQDYFNAALQMFDDIKDWRKDFSQARYSYLVTRGILEAGLVGAVEAGDPGVVTDLARQLYYSGPVEQAIDSALKWCDQAVECVSGYQLDGWVRLIRMLGSRIEGLRKDFGLIRVQTILRSQGYLSRGVDNLIGTASAALLAEQHLGYPEACHNMGFNLTGVATVNHAGSVFQRAILTDVLLDLKDHGLLADPSVADSEVESLVNSRLTTVRGGWSYFPTLKELPPDADDLGQILQVLVRSKYPSVGALADDAIDLLFAKNAHKDGSFETWIVDPDAEDDISLAMMSAIGRSWGKGADVEVVANMAYGLSLYQPDRFLDRIVDAATWVEAQQQPAGNWKPVWYATTYYGTWVAVRLLSTVKASSPALQAALRFLTANARDDGGFGDNGSTPLETALALLSLTLLDPAGSRGVINEAKRYLELTSADDGMWDETPFIRMEVDRASRAKGTPSRKVLTFSSRTLTTAWVLKSLLAARGEVLLGQSTSGRDRRTANVCP